VQTIGAFPVAEEQLCLSQRQGTFLTAQVWRHPRYRANSDWFAWAQNPADIGGGDWAGKSVGISSWAGWQKPVSVPG